LGQLYVKILYQSQHCLTMKYLLIDTANMFFRARHVAFRATDPWEKVGYALHITLAAIHKVYKKFPADHVVFAMEGRSWRKDVYKPYKANRAVNRAALTEAEQEEDKLFWETFDAFKDFLAAKTNCSVLRCATAEADDIIARWIALHPEDQHVIVSSDSDFVQLVAPNVKLYNGINEHLFGIDSVVDDKDRHLSFTIESNSKIKVGKPDANFVVPSGYQQWVLFMKCMRGDPGDNVFSAYPGVRVKGTKNQVGLTEAFEDRDRKGYAWNNLMLQRWTDHEQAEHRVLDDYERNRMLIDLTAQPEAIKATVDADIREQVTYKDVGMVGAHFMKFCGKYQLNKASDNAEQYSRWLNKTYQGTVIT
jgi:5'-3' exonuclease